MENPKKNYDAPRLTVHGTIESVTHAVNRQGFLDAVYSGGFICEPNSRSSLGACGES